MEAEDRAHGFGFFVTAKRALLGFGEAEDIDSGSPKIWGLVQARVGGNPSNVLRRNPAMEISARFSHEKLDPAKENTPHLVVSLKAPTLDWVKKRPSLCLLPVVDLSGSMSGSKLEGAKTSLHKLVDQLAPGDITGLIGFESRIHVLVPPAPVTPELKTRMHKVVSELKPMGGTDLCSGMLRAFELVEGLDLLPSFLRRVIVFTDGQPTNGVTDQGQILRLLGERRGSVTLSSFGYGNLSKDQYSGCDHDFLTRLSNDGKGNYAYVKGADDALTAFGRELGGLLSTYAQDVIVSLESAHGHSITKAVTDIAIEQDEVGDTLLKFPEILSEETRHFVFETQLKAQDKTFPRPLNLFKVRVVYSVLTEDGHRETRELETNAKAQFVAAGEAQTEPDKALDEVIAMAQLVRTQKEAETQAKLGNFGAAVNAFDGLVKDLERRGLSQTSGRIASSLQARVSSKSLYASSEGYMRTMAYAGTRSFGMASMDADAAKDLESCNVVLSNSAMQHTADVFASENLVATPPSVGAAIEALTGRRGEDTVVLNAEPKIWLPTDKSG